MKVKKTYTKMELLKLDPEKISSMTRNELRYVVSSMNRMISRQETTLSQLSQKMGGLSIPALSAIQKDKPSQYTATGELKNLNQLRSEAKRGFELMSMKTYSTEGATAHVKRTKTRIETRIREDLQKTIKLTDTDLVKFWEAYDKFMEDKEHISYDSNRVQTILIRMFIQNRSADSDELEELVNNYFEEEYKQKQIRKKQEEEAILEGMRNGSFRGGKNI